MVDMVVAMGGCYRRLLWWLLWVVAMVVAMGGMLLLPPARTLAGCRTLAGSNPWCDLIHCS